MLVAHVHPLGYAVAALILRYQLVESLVGKEFPAETLECPHLSVGGDEVEGIAVTVR